MHRNGKRRGDVIEMQMEHIVVRRGIDRSDVLEGHGWNDHVGISTNDQLNGLTAISTDANVIPVRIKQRQGE